MHTYDMYLKRHEQSEMSILTVNIQLKLLTKGSSIIFNIFTSVQKVLFLHSPPPPQKRTIKMLNGQTCFMY